MNKKIVSILIVAGALSMATACTKKEPEANVPVAETQTQVAVTETESQEPTEALTETETAAEEYDYQVCTDKSVEEVEAFAESITKAFADKNWESFAEIIYFPITINDKYYDNKDKFLENDWSSEFSQEYIDRVSNAQTQNLFCNWSGICLTDGEIWINEIDGQLVISSINYSDGSHVGEASAGPVGHWVIDFEKTDENLQNHDDLMQIFGSSIAVGGSMEIGADNKIEIAYPAEYLVGTYMQDESSLFVEYTDDHGDSGEMTVLCEMMDDVLYIVTEYDGEQIYWRKLAE